MRFCIATLQDVSYDHICKITTPIKHEYGGRHGYKVIIRRGNFPYSMVFWERHKWFNALLKNGNHDWLFCCGGDVLLTNLTIPLESLVGPDDHLVIARDARMVQSDVFLIRSSPQGLDFMSRLLASEERFKDDPLKDQSAMEWLFPQLAPGVVRIVPQRVLQGYEYPLYYDFGPNYVAAKDVGGNDGQWQSGDFALHVPAVWERKAEILTKYLPLIKR